MLHPPYVTNKRPKKRIKSLCSIHKRGCESVAIRKTVPTHTHTQRRGASKTAGWAEGGDTKSECHAISSGTRGETSLGAWKSSELHSGKEHKEVFVLTEVMITMYIVSM